MIWQITTRRAVSPCLNSSPKFHGKPRIPQLKQMIIFRSRGRCGRISFPPFPYILDLASSRGFSISIFAKFSLPMRKGLIRKEELGDKAVLPRLSKLEWIFKNKAYTYIRRVAEYEKEVRSLNIRGFSGYLAELLERFEGSRSLR